VLVLWIYVLRHDRPERPASASSPASFIVGLLLGVDLVTTFSNLNLSNWSRSSVQPVLALAAPLGTGALFATVTHLLSRARQRHAGAEDSPARPSVELQGNE